MGQISVRIVFRAAKKWGLVFLKSDLIDVNFKCFFLHDPTSIVCTKVRHKYVGQQKIFTCKSFFYTFWWNCKQDIAIKIDESLNSTTLLLNQDFHIFHFFNKLREPHNWVKLPSRPCLPQGESPKVKTVKIFSISYLQIVPRIAG